MFVAWWMLQCGSAQPTHRQGVTVGSLRVSSGQHAKAVMEAREYAARTEEFISQRHAEVYGLGEPLGFEDDRVTTFVDAFVEGGRYPIERITEVTLRAVDLRLQQEYIAFDCGSMNVILYGDHAEDEDYQAQARVRLARMALSNR
jgi:hypothetical protein